MPTTLVDIYPGSDYDFTFGGAATASWTVAPNFNKLADGSNDPADATFGRISPSVAAARTGYAEWKSATIPNGVSVSSLKIYAWILATGTGGTYQVPVAGLVRPSGSGSGSSGAYIYGTPVTLQSLSAAQEVYEELLIGEWTSNPSTLVAWTIAELQAMSWGIFLNMPSVAGIGNAAIKLGRIRLVAEVVTIDGNVEGVRVVGSSFLRYFGRPVRLLTLEGPAVLADVDQLETFTLEHFLGPSPDGNGWGPQLWSRRPLIAIEKSYSWADGRVTLKCVDPREVYCTWWSTFLTDIGHSPDGRGIPLLHSGGGGLNVTRNAVKYVERPGAPPDGLIMAVPAHRAAYSASGLVVEGDVEENRVVNSTLSLGATDVFDNWTKFTDGTGTVTESTTILFDVDSLRRTALVSVGSTDASQAYLQQAITVDSAFRVGLRTINNVGTGKLAAIIRRSSDGKDWNESTQQWETATVYNRIGNDEGGPGHWLSSLISSGADTITIFWGYFNESGTQDFAAFLCAAQLVDGSPTHIGTDLPTSTGVLQRTADIVYIQNNEVGRVWDTARAGSITFGFIPFWNGADLTGSVKKWLIVAANGGRIFYDSATHYMVFRRFGFLGSSVDAYVDLSADKPQRGVPLKVSVRWLAAGGEYGLPDYTHEIAVDNVWGVSAQLFAEPTLGPTERVKIGTDAPDNYPEGGATGWADGEFRHLDIVPLYLTDEEMQRRPY